MPLQSKILGPDFVVEIQGVNLSECHAEDKISEIKGLWLKNKVAIFRNQSLSDDDLMDFTEKFGPAFVHVRSQFNDPNRPGIMLISNIQEDGRNLGELGNGDLAWHSDQSYSAKPVFATLMYAIEVPMSGGNTWFCDLARAYEWLP